MSSRRSRRGPRVATAVTAALALAGVVVIGVGLRPSGGPPQPAHQAPQASTTHAAAAQAQPIGVAAVAPQAQDLTSRFLSRSRPVSLTIGAVGIISRTIVDLGKNSDGSLQVPTRFDVAGWFTAGPAPGQLGPAVLAGHVDSHAGPGVFYRLGAVRRGSTITVERADASTARFLVDRVMSFPKAQFPTAQVYGATSRAELRLITCGGSFDRRTGHYLNNTVVFAHLT